MANGDAAAAAGWDVLIGTDDRRQGFDEINKSRDYAAGVKAAIPVGKPAYRTASGISSGYGSPSGGSDGDIYFKIV